MFDWKDSILGELFSFTGDKWVTPERVEKFNIFSGFAGQYAARTWGVTTRMAGIDGEKTTIGTSIPCAKQIP